jgi:hypothetical protein
MTEIDGFTYLGGCGFGVGKVISFFPEETHHLSQEVVGKTIELSGFGVDMIDVVALTDLF